MNRTTKILLAVGGLLVLSYPGIAWLTGVAIESHIQHNEQRAIAQVPYLTLVSREYHRGVYQSTETATYGLRIPALKAAGAAAGASFPAGATITVASTIQHGPFPGLHAPALATVDSTLVMPAAVQKALSGVLGSRPLIEIHTTFGFFGGAHASLASPAFDLHLPDGSTLAWGGLTGTVTATRNQGRWSGQLSAPRLAVQSAQGGIELVGVEYTGTHEKVLDELYAGTGTFTIERVDGKAPRVGDYSLQRISLTSTAKAAGEFFDIRADIATDAAQFASISLKNVMYSESFEHVHGPSLASMVQAIHVAERQSGLDPTQLQTGMRDAVRQYGGDLLLHDPVINIRQVSFTMPEGSFLLSARLSAPGLSRADLQWPTVIAAVRDHAQLTADLKVDNALLQRLLTLGGANPRFAAQLAALEQQGYLTAGASTVTTHVEFSGGRLTLNGHAFPPAAPVN